MRISGNASGQRLKLIQRQAVGTGLLVYGMAMAVSISRTQDTRRADSLSQLHTDMRPKYVAINAITESVSIQIILKMDLIRTTHKT